MSMPVEKGVGEVFWVGGGGVSLSPSALYCLTSGEKYRTSYVFIFI